MESISTRAARHRAKGEVTRGRQQDPEPCLHIANGLSDGAFLLRPFGGGQGASALIKVVVPLPERADGEGGRGDPGVRQPQCTEAQPLAHHSEHGLRRGPSRTEGYPPAQLPGKTAHVQRLAFSWPATTLGLQPSLFHIVRSAPLMPQR